MVFYTSCIYAFKLVFKSLSSLPSPFGAITGLELHWMGDGSAGTKEAENNAIWWFSRRTVLMTVPDSGATRVTVPSECSSGRDFLGNYNHYGICPNYPYFLSQPPVVLIYHIFCFSLSFYAILDRRKPLEIFSKVDIRVFGEPIGLDLYCLLSHLDPNESLGIKIDQHRGQFHDSGLCMTSRHTRKNAQGELVTFTNQELARVERTNRQQPRQTDTTMGDHANQDDLAAAMTLMQQQMQQMQQTIQAQQDAAEHAALAHQEQQAQTKIDELTAKVDQLLKNNRGYVFNMEQATSGQIQNQNHRQPQSNQQAVPANGNSQPDELNSLEENTEQSAISGVTGPSVPSETPLVRVYFPKIRPLLQFFKNCRETQEEIKVLYTKALSTPALKVLPKVDDPGKFIFPCSIAGTTFKDALCDSEKLKVVPEKEHGDKGLELHWMGDGPAGTKEAENNAIWWFSRRTVLMTVPDSGATRVTVPTKVDIRVFGEPIGLDLYCLLSHLDPNESLGIKIDQHREQYHDSGLFYLIDPSSRLALN
ncbi:hypothetical protein IGI04_008181 [Brassica rapa subsp. trilocularis]|uniref:Uncharacterized protein n=1 Tax=Brassica rapa subsp. trilocularis TaxID=1813537 RepID=A0ABQ7NLY1_BRACM|nr:hypothetical protein IGI04_008181 [Brassica rapa subsp. trilocularis]